LWYVTEEEEVMAQNNDGGRDRHERRHDPVYFAPRLVRQRRNAIHQVPQPQGKTFFNLDAVSNKCLSIRG
jgi:hypothetical protein